MYKLLNQWHSHTAVIRYRGCHNTRILSFRYTEQNNFVLFLCGVCSISVNIRTFSTVKHDVSKKYLCRTDYWRFIRHLIKKKKVFYCKTYCIVKSLSSLQNQQRFIKNIKMQLINSSSSEANSHKQLTLLVLCERFIQPGEECFHLFADFLPERLNSNTESVLQAIQTSDSTAMCFNLRTNDYLCRRGPS